MWKKGLRKLLIALVVIGFFVLVSFVNSEQESQSIVSFDVDINLLEADNFLSEKEAKAIIISKVDTLKGRPVNKVSLNDIEKTIELEPGVKNAEAFLGINGDVHLKIELKKVLVRIKPDTLNGFYIDTEGKVMDWVPNCTPKVLTVYGHLDAFNDYLPDSLSGKEKLNKPMIKQLFYLANFLAKSDFWKAQFGNVYVQPNGDLELIPLMGNHTVEIGKVANLENKFDRLELFYKKIVDKKGWDAYSKVSVKFKEQIVCTKR